jgi:hypothetical protein
MPSINIQNRPMEAETCRSYATNIVATYILSFFFGKCRPTITIENNFINITICLILLGRTNEEGRNM